MVKKYFFLILLLIAVIFPAYSSLRSIIQGSIPFWYDPARDFLLASDNLKKITLIGPTTGIPGLFYGPYWIWLISIFMLLSRDPRVVTFFILFIPYYILFPLTLFKFQKTFSKWVCLSLWILFISSFSFYSTFLWNPHLAPLLYLLLGYFIVFGTKASKWRSLLTGAICGLILNIHISFGLGIFIASTLYLFAVSLHEIVVKRKHVGSQLLQKGMRIGLFIVGVLIVFSPFFFFEFRHQFMQLRALAKTITDAALYNSAAVGQTGLTKEEIIPEFIKTWEKLTQFKIADLRFLVFLTFGNIFFLFLKKRASLKEIFTQDRFKLGLFLIVSLISLATLYYSSKNPVWAYHFIAVEVIYLLIIGVWSSWFSFVRYGLYVWVIYVFMNGLGSFIHQKPVDPVSLSSYATKKYVVDTIYQAQGSKPFAVYAYSPAIYTFDYDYVFMWQKMSKKTTYPSETEDRVVYLIVPKTTKEAEDDFIGYKTPHDRYKTIKIWDISDGSKVIKRAKIN